MKEKTMANLEQYRAVLDDLMKQRNELHYKIGEIDHAVAALRRLMPIEEKVATRDSQQPLPMVTSGKYAQMSTRWAILWLLAEDASTALSTGQIADALRAGGMVSGAKSFSGNVSAVLSGMNHERNEVAATPEGWVITENGKSAWIHIRASREKHATPIAVESASVQ